MKNEGDKNGKWFLAYNAEKGCTMTKTQFENARKDEIALWTEALYGENGEFNNHQGLCACYPGCVLCPLEDIYPCGTYKGLKEPSYAMAMLMWLMTDCTWENYGGHKK